ncbi:uncharacterized protein TNCV_4283671 [Trichonephila clavipes]|nr:uncharacterized protein TNCV_4283671 [Trichonephila clavipes]
MLFHPPCSPPLASRDFFLFPESNNHWRFDKKNDVIQEEEQWFFIKFAEKEFFIGGFRKVFKMSRKKLFKTDEEAVEYLFLEELESKMIALPPEVDELTDEEGFDDTEALDLSVRDIAVSIKIYVPYENHDDHRETDLSNKSKKRSCSES